MSDTVPANVEAPASAVPDHFICPISLEIMKDPVICTDGNTYERAEILRWLSTHDTSPKTNVVLRNKTLITNFAIKSGIEKYLATNVPKKKVGTIKTRSAGAAEVIPEQVVNRKMQIFVRLLSNSTLTVFVEKNATVKELGEEIERVDGIQADHQRLIHCGKQMEPHLALKEYGVVGGSMVHLVLRLVGGAAAAPMIV